MEQKNVLNSLPDEYRPLSGWAYFGYSLLFAIPIAGFVCACVFAFNNSNINRRNYARYYFVSYIVVIVLYVIIFIAFFIFAGRWIYQSEIYRIPGTLSNM